MSDKLKSCPFCGGVGNCNNVGLCDKDGNPLWWVECIDCGINTAGHTTQNEAITSWNRRPAAHMYTEDELYDKNGSPVWGEVYGYELYDTWLLVDADNRELIDCTGQRYGFCDVVAYDRELEDGE